MSATVSENFLSRSFTVGKQAVRELIFDIHGATDENDALTALAVASAGIYQGLLLDSLNADPVGGTLWKGFARYTRLENNDEYTFDTTGGTKHITQSIATVAAYAPPGQIAPDFQGAIGVSADKVEGVDIGSSAYQFTETHYFSDSAITTTYKRLLKALTNKFNDAPFKGFEAGEVIFRGATGSKRGDEQWALTYRFEVSENETGLEIGGTTGGAYDDSSITGSTITGIDKLGWDYLWTRYEDFEDMVAYSLVKQPTAVYVERVYHAADFSLLSIGT